MRSNVGCSLGQTIPDLARVCIEWVLEGLADACGGEGEVVEVTGVCSVAREVEDGVAGDAEIEVEDCGEGSVDGPEGPEGGEVLKRDRFSFRT